MDDSLPFFPLLGQFRNDEGRSANGEELIKRDIHRNKAHNWKSDETAGEHAEAVPGSESTYSRQYPFSPDFKLWLSVNEVKMLLASALELKQMFFIAAFDFH